MPDLPCKPEMKLDPQKIRQLREERSWTQEHLATVAGLSLRTVQRIEREGNGSSDSRLSLAAAFGVDLAAISDTPVAIEPTAPSPQDDMSSLFLPRDPRKEFLQHLWFYLAGAAFFLGGDLWQNHAITWAHWPMLGWGAGLALHGRHAWAQLQKRTPSSEATRVQRRAFQEHIAAWFVMSIVFLIADLWPSGHLTWAFYPILGWGAGLFAFRHNLAPIPRSE
jgi:transcriptional regulator with XRE-family HTH domain